MYLERELGCSGPLEDGVRYQLLHRTVSVLLTARAFHAQVAVMLVQSFSPVSRWREDFEAFIYAVAARPITSDLYELEVNSSPRLLSGWCRGGKEFLDRLPSAPVARTVRKLIASARDLGAIVEPRGSSVSVRLNDPNGSKQKLTLFLITTAGELYTGWLSGQLESIGSDKGIAANWVASVANLVPGVQPSPKYPDGLSRSISVEEIEPLLDDFIERLGETIETIRSTAG